MDIDSRDIRNTLFLHELQDMFVALPDLGRTANNTFGCIQGFMRSYGAFQSTKRFHF